MKQLGALEFLTIGLGDDQAKQGYFTAFDPWFLALKTEVSKVFYITFIG
jgi:hypothetical protein